MMQMMFTPEFQERMKFLKDLREREGGRDYSVNPSTFTTEELRAQIEEHKKYLEQRKKEEINNN